MAAKFSLGNLAATLHNLNMTGSFDSTSNTPATYAPNDTIGLYQLLNKIISDLVSVKNKIKATEKIIETELSTAAIAGQGTASDTDNDQSTTAAFLHTLGITTIEPANEEGNISTLARGKLEATVASATSGAGINKPSILAGSDSKEYSEDAVFVLLRAVGVIINNMNNSTADLSEHNTAPNSEVAGITGNIGGSHS